MKTSLFVKVSSGTATRHISPALICSWRIFLALISACCRGEDPTTSSRNGSSENIKSTMSLADAGHGRRPRQDTNQGRVVWERLARCPACGARRRPASTSVAAPGAAAPAEGRAPPADAARPPTRTTTRPAPIPPLPAPERCAAVLNKTTIMEHRDDETSVRV